MPSYRNSEAGRQRLVTLAGRQSFVFSGFLTTGLVLVFTYKYGLEMIREIWWLFAAIGTLLATAYYFGQRRQVQKLTQALTVTLEDDALTVDNGPTRLSIAPHEVTAFGYIKEGIKIRGRDLNHLFVLYRDLEDFPDLQSRLEQWVPAHIPRTSAGSQFGYLLWAAILAPLAVLLAAFAIPNAALNLAAALLLAGCVIWLWRSPAVPVSTKRLLLIAILPIWSFLQRAYIFFNLP